MQHVFEAFTTIGLYAALLIAVGIYLARTEDRQDYIIGGRTVGVLPTAASLAASFRDGGGLALWIGMGLAGGYGGMWLFFGIFLGSLVLTACGPAVRARAAELRHLTISEIVGANVGFRAARLTALVTLVFTFALTALQFYVSGAIFSALLGQPQWLGVALVCALLAAYIVMGGYKSVIITDTIQFFFIISLACAPFILPVAAEDMTNMGSLLAWPHDDKLAFTLYGAFFILSMPEAWQRMLSARDARTIRLAMPLMNLMLVFMTLGLIWMGMGMRVLPPETVAGYAEPYLAVFDPALGISPWVLGYLVMVFLAITMSTQSSACCSFTSTLTQIFLSHKAGIEEDQKLYVRRMRLQTVTFLVLSALASLTMSGVVQTVFEIISFFICLAPVYVLAAVNPSWLAGWARRDAVLTGLTLLGIMVYIVLFLTGVTGEAFLYGTLPAALTGFLTVIAGVAAQRRKKDGFTS